MSEALDKYKEAMREREEAFNKNIDDILDRLTKLARAPAEEQKPEWYRKAERISNQKETANIITSLMAQYRLKDDLTVFTNPDFDKILTACGLPHTDDNIYKIGEIVREVRELTRKKF